MKISRLPIHIFEQLRSDEEVYTCDDELEEDADSAPRESVTSSIINTTTVSASRPEDLRERICRKLAAAGMVMATYSGHQNSRRKPPNDVVTNRRNPYMVSAAIQTTSQLLQLSPLGLLRILDPILTYGTMIRL